MDQKKLKRIIICVAFALLLLIIVSTLMNHLKNNRQKVIQNNDNNNTNKDYSFNETIDLDREKIVQKYDPQIGTEYPSIGTISDYYENTDVHYEDDKIYMQSYNGYDVISESWKNEGFATLINEPQFGEIEKFVLSSSSISAIYTEVKMKDVVSYINELSGLGFNDVVKDDKNSSNDYYIYSAKKGDLTVTINYEKGKLYIYVF